MKNLIKVFTAFAMSLPWVILQSIGYHDKPYFIALFSGIAIIGAAVILSWGAETSQLDIPQALAIAFLALITVLPEYAVDMYFTWKAAKDPVYTSYAVANMTGANRLLIGIGWSTIVLLFWFKSKNNTLELEERRGLETVFLTLASLYAFFIPFKKTISLIDTAVLLSLFILYIVKATTSAKDEELELEGVPQEISNFSPFIRRIVYIFFFSFAGYVIYISAEPFAEGLVHTGKMFGIDEFLLVQWLAPLASESPEMIVACILVLNGKANAAIGALISSKLNQWTLLIGAIPIVYSISAGTILPLPLDVRQVNEMFLTSSQSIFALSIISDFKMKWYEAIILMVLFSIQLLIPIPWIHFLFSIIYLSLTVVILIYNRKNLGPLLVIYKKFLKY